MSAHDNIARERGRECACAECTTRRATGESTLRMQRPVVAVVAQLQLELHAARTELTKAKLCAEIIARKLGVPCVEDGDPDYQRIVAAIDDLRVRCGETEPGGNHAG